MAAAQLIAAQIMLFVPKITERALLELPESYTPRLPLLPQYISKPLRSIVPLVCVILVPLAKLHVPVSVVVPVPENVGVFKVVLPLVLKLPEPVNTSVPRLAKFPVALKVIPAKFIVVNAGVHVLPVKSKFLNQLPLVNVGILAPPIIDKLGATVGAAVAPQLNVRVADMVELKPPVPLALKPVAVAILREVIVI